MAYEICTLVTAVTLVSVITLIADFIYKLHRDDPNIHLVRKILGLEIIPCAMILVSNLVGLCIITTYIALPLALLLLLLSYLLPIILKRSLPEIWKRP